MIICMNVSNFVKKEICHVLTIFHLLICRGPLILGHSVSIGCSIILQCWRWCQCCRPTL